MHRAKMWRVIVFVFLTIIIVSCRNIPDLQDETTEFDSFSLQEKDDGILGSADIIKESSGNSCVNDEKNKCKNEEIKSKSYLPPQLPKLTGYTVNDEERIWLQSPYQVNHYANSGTLGVAFGNHGGVLYPYVHPDLIAALNPALPVSQLPPVLTTHILEAAPYFIPHIYAHPRTRFTRDDEEEDYLNQLTHDAIMANVLPTMQVPMAKSSFSSVPTIASPSTALYPADVGSCGIPILVSCTPAISKGVLAAHRNQGPIEHKYRTERTKKEKKDIRK